MQFLSDHHTLTSVLSMGLPMAYQPSRHLKHLKTNKRLFKHSQIICHWLWFKECLHFGTGEHKFGFVLRHVDDTILQSVPWGQLVSLQGFLQIHWAQPFNGSTSKLFKNELIINCFPYHLKYIDEIDQRYMLIKSA